MQSLLISGFHNLTWVKKSDGPDVGPSRGSKLPISCSRSLISSDIEPTLTRLSNERKALLINVDFLLDHEIPSRLSTSISKSVEQGPLNRLRISPDNLQYVKRASYPAGYFSLHIETSRLYIHDLP